MAEAERALSGILGLEAWQSKGVGMREGAAGEGV